MNSNFKKRQVDYLFKIILFGIILFGLHSYISYYFIKTLTFFSIWQIYVFLSLITFLIFLVINYKYSNGTKEIFNLFLVSTMLKMFIAIIFLIPLILSNVENKIIDVINFFIPYFFFLFFEVITINALLKKNS